MWDYLIVVLDSDALPAFVGVIARGRQRQAGQRGLRVGQPLSKVPGHAAPDDLVGEAPWQVLENGVRGGVLRMPAARHEYVATCQIARGRGKVPEEADVSAGVDWADGEHGNIPITRPVPNDLLPW